MHGHSWQISLMEINEIDSIKDSFARLPLSERVSIVEWLMQNIESDLTATINRATDKHKVLAVLEGLLSADNEFVREPAE